MCQEINSILIDGLRHSADTLAQKSQSDSTDSLRSFLDILRQHQLLNSVIAEVEEAVSITTPHTHPFERAKGSAALLVENSTGGERYLCNALGSWRNCALAIGLSASSSIEVLLETLCDRAGGRSGTTVVVPKPVCHENIVTSGIHLDELLPLARLGADGPRYLTKGIAISRERQSGRECMSTPLIEVSGPDRLIFHLEEVDELACLCVSEFGVAKSVPVAICIGAPPSLHIACAERSLGRISKFKLASCFSGVSLGIARARTVPIDIPAEAEVVIEGYLAVSTSDRSDKCRPVLEVSAVTHRMNPILENMPIGEGWTEYDCLDGLRSFFLLHSVMWQSVCEIVKSGRKGSNLSLQVVQRPGVRKLIESLPAGSANTLLQHPRGHSYT